MTQKERGIIFTAWSIPKIMDRTKTQTRRVIESRLSMQIGSLEVFKEADHYEAKWISKDGIPNYCDDLLAHCPYGQVGDRLYLKETWAEQGGDIYYKTDWGNSKPVNMVYDNIKWRSPRFMPRWASRIDLEITDLGAERLWGISWQDCICEGITAILNKDVDLTESDIICAFATLWDSLNPRYPWDFNPWVWPISFKLL